MEISQAPQDVHAPHPKSFLVLEFETLPTQQRHRPLQQGGSEVPIGFFSSSSGM